MIVSYSQDFAVIRAPKTGSTSLVFYFFKSGLLDHNHDIYAIEGPCLTWQELEDEYKKHRLKQPIGPSALTPSKQFKDVHLTFNEMYEQGLIRTDMPCVGTIRNPLERIASIYNYPKFFASKALFLTEEPNEYWDNIKQEIKDQGGYCSLRTKPFKAQSEYFPDHAELFNTESLHKHIIRYISDKGGKVNERIEMRKNHNNDLQEFLLKLTLGRKQEILDTYQKDYELWEKSYATYN